MGIESWYNTLNIDMQWMSLFQVETAETSTEVHVVDWLNKMRHKQYDLVPQSSPCRLAPKPQRGFGRKRYGGGSFADHRSSGHSAAAVHGEQPAPGHQVAEWFSAPILPTQASSRYPNGTTSFSTNIVQTANSA